MLFLEKQPHQRLCSEEINNCQTGGNHAAEHSANTAILFGKALVTCAQTPPDQRDGRRLQTVPEGERQPHNIHAHLMSRHGIRPLLCRHDCRQHKADPHKHLFKENAVTYMD